MQSATFEIGKFFNENNWNVSIITNRYPRILNLYEIINGLRVNRYTFLANPFHYLRSGRIDLFVAWFFYKPVTLIRLIIDFIRFKPKVVNLHFPDHQLLECYLLMLIFRFKLIISLHGNEVERMRSLSKRSIRYYLYNKLFTSAVKITGCSQYLLDQFHVLFPRLNRKKYMPLHNGVNEKYFEQPLFVNKNEYIFSAARFVPKKGFELLLGATRKFTGNQLFIAGGDENDFLTLGLKKREGLILLGPLSRDEMAKHLAVTKLTVVPSKIEPYGIIVAEAMCCGSPVVVTNVGGIPEVIAIATEKLSHQEKGIFNQWVILVEPDIESIRSGIQKIKSNNKIEDYINIIPKIRSQFHWEKRLRAIQQILISN